MKKLLLILTLLASPLSANSLLLDSTSKSLEMATSAAVSTDYVVSYADHTTTAFTPGMSQGNVASATDTTILAAPAASTQRQVKWISVRNRSTTTAQVVTLQLDVSGTEYVLGPDVTLAAGESLRWDADGSLAVFTRAGVRKERNVDQLAYSGLVFDFYKVGTASEAAARFYTYADNSGLPGAWTPGTPGLDGYNTDCGTADNATSPVGAVQMGSHHLPDPASGNYYLTSYNANATTPHFQYLIDPVWYNTGLVSATTTAQAITTPAFPARDVNGTSAGDGYAAALFFTTGGAAGVISNTTMEYTNSDGVGSRTATISSVPASPVVGTWVPFQLAAGDRGIESIEGVTLGTSYGAAVLSLVVYRVLATSANPVANVGGTIGSATFFDQSGIRIYNDTCFWLMYLGSTTTATNVTATVTVQER